MFNVPPNAGFIGFRVGLPDDEDDPALRTLPATPSAAVFGYDPYGNALQTTAPTAFSPAGPFYNADSGLYPPTYRPYVPVAGGSPSQDPLRQTSDRPANLYADVGANPPGFSIPQGLSAHPIAPIGIGSPPPSLAASPAPPDEALRSDLQGNGEGFTLARYGAGDLLNRADPSRPTPNAMQNTSDDDGFQLVRSAQAQTPQARTPIDTSLGEAVVLPDGLTIPTIDSPTREVMSPVTDLSPVAAAGRQTGATFRAMLNNPDTAAGAALYLYATLGLNLGHGGTFDYQRRGNHITGFVQLPQFREVSNINVGLFAQQAGLTLDEIMKIAGTFARLRSDNYRPDEPHGLDAQTALYIRAGYNIGRTGVFGQSGAP